MVLDRMPDAAREELDRLRDDWGSFEVYQERKQVDPDQYDPKAAPDHDLYRFASAWVRRDGEALLVRPNDTEKWTAPGGTWEPGETYEETAKRETREETGVDCEFTGIVEVRMGVDEFGDRGQAPWMGAVFDAEYVAGEPRRQPEEIAELRWVSEVPDADELVFERMAGYPL
jgi:8-oxo-dGTP diphosphatase